MLLSGFPEALRDGLREGAFGLGLAPMPLAGAQAAHKITAPAQHVADTVVWRARGSKAFHTATSKYFGKTKHGSYVCEKAALAKGLHAAKP